MSGSCSVAQVTSDQNPVTKNPMISTIFVLMRTTKFKSRPWIQGHVYFQLARILNVDNAPFFLIATALKSVELSQGHMILSMQILSYAVPRCFIVLE